MVDLKKYLKELQKLHPIERLEKIEALLSVVSKDKKLRNKVQKELDKTIKELQDLRLWKGTRSLNLTRVVELPQEPKQITENLEEKIIETPKPKEESKPLRIYSPDQEKKPEDNYKIGHDIEEIKYNQTNHDSEAPYQHKATTQEQEKNFFNAPSFSQQIDNYQTNKKREKKEKKNGSGY